MSDLEPARRRTAAAPVWCALTALLCLFSESAYAQSPFYQGKTVNIVVSYAPGGGYDFYSRLLAKHLADHIPGKPTVVVQNMPGAAGVVAANNVYAIAAKDGTFIAAVDQNIPMFQLLGGEGVRYDATRFNWLGVMASSNGMVLSWAASGIKTLDDARRQTVATGATGANDDVWVYAKMLNATTGTRFNLITGYQGTSAVNVAIERGEVQAMGRSSYYGFRAQKPDWLRDGKVNILAQIGFAKQQELPNVPLLLDLMSSDEERQMAQLVSLPTAIGYSHWVAPEVPADRVQILRDAYAETLKDPALLADAQKQNLEIVPKTAAQVAALVKQAADAPPEIRLKAAQILGWK